MAERQSVTSFVMSDRLPWPDDAPPADRLGVLDAVSLFQHGEMQPCTIRKISPLGATLRGAGAQTIGEEVAIELATGQRAAGTVAWSVGDEAGIRFKQPVDMLALLNRTLVAQTSERRKMPRVELRCHVGVKWGINLAAATLRNISAGGLQIEGDGLPPRDTLVTLFIDGINMPSGVVVWERDGLAGIELMEELAWSSIMPWIRDQQRKSAIS